MKIQYLGTAAYEGIPALFCNCDICRRSRAAGGRALRTRSQALVDGQLLLDFNADTVAHCIRYGIDLLQVPNCLITHSHSDHLYPQDISMLGHGYSHPKPGYHISFYGSDTVIRAICGGIETRILEEADIAPVLNTVRAFEPFQVGPYRVTALPGNHDPRSGPLFYMIEKGGKTMLYAHDTGFFFDSVWEYFEKVNPRFDFVSLDCTSGNLMDGGCHMGFGQNIAVKKRMLEHGWADEKTIFVCNHFSHNGKDTFYDDFVEIGLKEGFRTSYDGMTVEF